MEVGIGGIGLGFGFLFIVVSLFIFGVFVFVIVSIIKNATKNNNKPRLTVDATVIGKRDQVRGENTYTYYFATFEFDSGDRAELEMKGQESGMLVEGDFGKLTFQGTKFISFDRMKKM